MANKLFKGFQQVTEGSFEAQAGYIYFVRNQSNTGKTDGYLLFNGRKYGTAEEATAVLEGRIGTLPEGYDSLKAYIDAQLTGITGSYATNEALGTLSGRVDTLETSAATKTEVGTLSGRVDTLEAVSADTRLNALEAISGDSHTHSNKNVLDGITTEKVADWDGVAGSADTRISAIEADYLKAENLTGTTDALGTLSGRVDDIENDYLTSTDKTALESSIGNLSGDVGTLMTVSADTRIAALEELSGNTHTHGNKSVLDGITQEKVDAWDALSANSVVVVSALTGDDVTSGMVKTYEIFQGGSSVGKIDVPKDMVVSSGEVVEGNNGKVLRLTIANSNQTVDIPVSDLAHVYRQGNGIEISNADEISAKVVTGNGLTLDSNGIAMGSADGSNAGAMSAADFTKLGTIEASAQTNVIEEVKVNGTALTVTNKAVDITLPDYTNTYAPLSLTGTVETNRTAFDNYTGATDERLGHDEQVFDAYTAATDTAISNMASADTRLNVLETSAATKTEVGAVSGRVDTLETSATTWNNVASSAATWNGVAGSADTRIAALEAISANTSSALQTVSEGDASVTIGTKANNDQTIAVALSAESGNTLELKNDGLFAAVYYDGNDSD